MIVCALIVIRGAISQQAVKLVVTHMLDTKEMGVNCRQREGHESCVVLSVQSVTFSLLGRASEV